MKFGYIRVSSSDQNIARQEAALEPLCDDIIIDRVSGRDTKRPGLELLLMRLRDGDELIVKSIDRLARNTRDLLQLIDDLTHRGVTIRFLDTKIDFDNSPTTRFMLTMMGAAAELERGFINARQEEGIKLAKERGVYKGRPIDKELRVKLGSLFDRGMTPSEAAKIIGCGRTTAFRIRKELAASGELL